MRNGLLVRHFLNQFVENDLSPDADRHQVLALTTAALVTVPLFVTMFMGMRYLMRPLQAPGWTVTTAMEDEVVFCAASMLVAAVVATLEWDALGLSPRDAVILGVLPVSHRTIVRAKITSLLTFAAAFVLALNAWPTLLHPPLMVAQLPLNPVVLVPLIGAQALSTMTAGAFGFACVLGVRESLCLCLGRRRFTRISGFVRSGLLFSLLMLLALVPIRLSGSADWMFEPVPIPVLLRPVSWFAALHAATAGRVVDRLPRPDLPTPLALEERRLTVEYRRSLPELSARAFRGIAVLAVTLTASLVIYLWNARRLQILMEVPGRTSFFELSRFSRQVARTIVRRPARRAGMWFLVKTVSGNPLHRAYLIAFTVAGLALLLAMGITAYPMQASLPLRTSTLAAQTLMLAAVTAGFRAAIRTSADHQASWLFGVAETGTIREFRRGVRAGVMAVVVAILVLLLPVYRAAWGLSVALLHTMNGMALGWLLVEIAFANVDKPLVWTIPPSDSLNTEGVVRLGAAVIAIFAVAHIELAALSAGIGRIIFTVALLVIAAAVHHATERDLVGSTALPPSSTGGTLSDCT